MKETITQDVAMAVAKVAPAAGVTAGTYTPGYTLSDIALICTILFTLLQAFSVVVKNWGDWTQWGRARWATVRRVAAWVFRRGG
jgi:hypothetical protein